MLRYRSNFRLIRLYGRAFVHGLTVRRLANALKTEWAYRRRTIDMRSKPYVLFIEPLYYCNLRCPLCARQQPEFQGTKDKLAPEVIQKIFDEVGPYLFQCSIFGMGEPTLDWSRTQAIIDQARKHRIFTMVSTNATLITPALAERIVDSGLDYLVCAIDGATQEAYGSYRIGGKLEDAMNGMRYVLAAKRRKRSRMVVEWQFLVNAHNEHELDEARKIAKREGVNIRFASIGGMTMDPDDVDRWASKDPKYRKAVRVPGQALNPYNCYWLYRSIYVNATGTMGRCPVYSSTHLIGDLKHSSVQEIFNNADSQAQRRIFNRAPLPDGLRVPEPCNTCTYYTRCHAPTGGAKLDYEEGPQAPKPLAAKTRRLEVLAMHSPTPLEEHEPVGEGR